MKKTLLTISLLLAANIAMAQSTPAAEGTDTQSKSTPGEPATFGGSVNAPLATPTSSWRKKLKFEAYYGVWGGVADVNDGNNSGNGVDMYVQALRDIGKGQSLGLRVNGSQNQTNETTDAYETRISDPQIMYKNPFFHSTLRLSLPVSEVSREIGRYELRYNGGTDLVDAGRFTVGGGLEARAYAYSQDASGQRYARYRAIASPSYKVFDQLSIISAAIYDVKFNKNGEGYGFLDPSADVGAGAGKKARRATDRRAVIDLGLSIQAIPKILLIEPYIEQDHGLDSADAVKLFNEDNTSYNVEFTLTM
jgi:hypothetical protein